MFESTPLGHAEEEYSKEMQDKFRRNLENFISQVAADAVGRLEQDAALVLSIVYSNATLQSGAISAPSKRRSGRLKNGNYSLIQS